VRPLDDEEVDGVAEVVLVRPHDRWLRIDLQFVGQAFLAGADARRDAGQMVRDGDRLAVRVARRVRHLVGDGRVS
jgi:hypothetical protein